MEEVYKEVLDFVVSSGKRIKKKAGKIKELDLAKKEVTEEDFIIERGIKKIIKRFNPKHELFAEEENNKFPNAQDIWIADPISGTKIFIEGKPHYAIVVAHMRNKEVQFAAVYDPSVDELYTAFLGKGAFLNGCKINVTKNEKDLKIIFNRSHVWKERIESEEMVKKLSKFDTQVNEERSFAVNYCYVALGKYDGFVAFTKDVFPEIAGSLIIKEAGGVFKTQSGENQLNPKECVFVGGNKFAYNQLKDLVKGVKR